MKIFLLYFIIIFTFTICKINAQTVSSNSPVCSGNQINIFSSGGTSYSWTGPNGFTSILQNPIITNASAANQGTYSVAIKNEWVQKTNFGGSARRGSVSFSIGSKGYVGTGYISPGNYKNDFWEYDPSLNAWTQKANFGGTARYEAAGFSIGSKGYLGTGIANAGDIKNDFWEYNPVSNAWTPKANFGGPAVYGAIGISMGGFGYMGIGYSNNYRIDYWKYDPTTNAWTQHSFYPQGTYTAVGFSIGTDIYIGTGLGNPVSKKDFWKAGGSGGWTQLADFGGTARNKAVGFAIGNNGYIGTGIDINGNYMNDIWEYDPTLNTWMQKANFAGEPRSDAVGFTIGNKAYVGLGFNGSINKNDFWEYTPNPDATNLSTSVSILNPIITATASSNSPVCSGKTLNLSASGGTSYSWTGANGFTSTLQNPIISNASSINAGSYTVVVSTICSSSSSSTTVVINPSPTATASSNSPVCKFKTINLFSSGGPSYSWSGPATFTSSLQNPTISNAQPSNAGVYTVTLTNASGCTSSASTSVILNPVPTITLASNSPICQGNALNLFCSNSVSFLWTKSGSSYISTQQNPSIQNATPSNSGTYSCTTTDANGCNATASISVIVNSSPIATISNNGPLCEGNSLNLTSSGGTSYLWGGVNSFSSTLQNPTLINVTSANSGSYSVRVTNSNLCSITLTTSVTVFPGSVNDNNVCTTDACNTLTGPTHIISPIQDDGNACTMDGCNSLTGPTHIVNNIENDNNVCTTDGCDSLTGPTHISNPIENDFNDCTTDGCNTLSGPTHVTNAIEDDNNVCTTDVCNSITGVFHFPIPNCLNSNIFIQGYYIGGGLMTNYLNAIGLSTNPLDADVVTISAMNPTSPFTIVDSQEGTLKTNGDISVIFGPSVIAGNTYYLKINHRNSAETWSKTPVLLTPSKYLFSSVASQAYGDNEVATFDNLYYAIYSGDINQDGAVDGTDFIELEPRIQNGNGGYDVGDFNGDGAVDGSDYIVLDPNIQNGIGVSTP